MTALDAPQVVLVLVGPYERPAKVVGVFASTGTRIVQLLEGTPGLPAGTQLTVGPHRWRPLPQLPPTDPRHYDCPTCKVLAGKPCRSIYTNDGARLELAFHHVARLALAVAAADPDCRSNRP